MADEEEEAAAAAVEAEGRVRLEEEADGVAAVAGVVRECCGNDWMARAREASMGEVEVVTVAGGGAR